MSVEEIEALQPEKIIISPGPASPDEAGITLEVIRYFKDKVPILGICLGHQSIAQVFGGDVIRAKNMMHGKTSIMKQVSECVIFKDLPQEFVATRYHSLIVDKNNLPKTIEPTAFSADDNEIMALKIKDYPIYGVQFHPESIMSEYGHEMIGNFLNL
jgi:anthranilate synthase component 2